MKTAMNCTSLKAQLPELLLDASVAGGPVVVSHLESCAECRNEWQEMEATFAALDEWKVPEPSAYFDARLRARLREEVVAEPEGFFERVRSFLLFSTGRQLRPALAGALALVLLVGGGTGLVGLHEHLAAEHGSSATLNDLKVLDNNAQALQQMDQLLDDGNADEGGAAPTT